MEKLAERFEIFAPEHPGYGNSEAPEWLDTVGDLAYFYLDLIKQFGLKNLTLVGSSLGGWTAAELAVRSCHDLKALVLSCPAGIHVKGVPKADLFLWSPEDTIRNMYFDPKVADGLLAVPITDEQRMVIAKNRLTTAKLGWQPRLYNPHLHKWLHRISVPTLIVWGGHDKLIPPAYGPAFQRLIPGSKLEVIENCGHAPQTEKADEWVDKIVAFVREATG
jgi:pimeloyl-ACP methyl ester carboxylesterase